MPYWNNYNSYNNNYYHEPTPPIPESPISPENRADVLELNEIEYQRDIVHQAVVVVNDTFMIPRPYNVNVKLFETIPQLHAALHNPFMYQDVVDFDIDWYMEARRWCSDLHLTDKYIVRRYTRNGDEIVNSYLRDPASFPTDRATHLFRQMSDESRPFLYVQFLRRYLGANFNAEVTEYLTQTGEVLNGPDVYVALEEYETATATIEQKIELMMEYIEDLKQILLEAPRPTKPTRVFRGIKHDFLRNSVGDQFQIKGFLSTTASPDIVTRFGKRNVHEIILEPGTPCLPVDNVSFYEDEMEILVIPDLIVQPDSKYKKYMLQSDYNGFIDQNQIWTPYTYNEGLYSTPYYSRHVFAVSEENNSNENGGENNNNNPLARIQVTPSGGRITKKLKTRRSKTSKSVKSARKSARKSIRSRKSKTMNQKDQEFWKVRDPADPLFVKVTPTASIRARLQALKDKYTIHRR